MQQPQMQQPQPQPGQTINVYSYIDPQGRQQIPQMQAQQMPAQLGQPQATAQAPPQQQVNDEFFAQISKRLIDEPNLPPSAAESFGEVWLIILCQSLKIAPDQAIALLRAPGALSRGMAWGADKGRAADILRWMRAIYAHRRTIVSCMKLGGGDYDPHMIAPAVYSCLHPLHACLFSKDTTVVAEACTGLQ